MQQRGNKITYKETGEEQTQTDALNNIYLGKENKENIEIRR